MKTKMNKREKCDVVNFKKVKMYVSAIKPESTVNAVEHSTLDYCVARSVSESAFDWHRNNIHTRVSFSFQIFVQT